ncbi:kinase-like domain-containing protein [Xylaria sp. FL0933]|nr:kinase-like domain-containing protein [Xylaria sp. FL0933]
MAADAGIPESVQDARWEADFEPNPHRLGHGGFGVVWLEKAHSANQSSICLRAVKELRVGQENIRRRECIRELQALVKFSQQRFVGSFVEFYNWYENNDALFIAMEYCRHGDLNQFVKDHGAIVEVDVQKITDQVLQALMFMHESNFAHRDLKPANILIKHRPPDSEWKIKVGDMGLSKRIGVEPTSTTVKGTPGFIAPERIPGIGPTHSATDPFSSDMWCLGEVVFFLLTSEKTFDSSMQLQGYYNGKMSFPEERLQNAKVSQQAIDFVKALMAVQPSERLSAFQADYHLWMRDTSSIEGPQQGLPDTLPYFFYSSTFRSKDPVVDEMHEKLAGASLDELTIRDIAVPDPLRRGADIQSVPSGSWDTSTVLPSSPSVGMPVPEQSDLGQGTMSIPSGTWNSYAAHPTPAAPVGEPTAVISADKGVQRAVLNEEEKAKSDAGTGGHNHTKTNFSQRVYSPTRTSFVAATYGTIWHINETTLSWKTMKYEWTLRSAIRYILRTGGTVRPYPPLAMGRPFYFNVYPSCYDEYDAKEHVFLPEDDDEEESSYPTLKRLKQEHVASGEDMSLDGGSIEHASRGTSVQAVRGIPIPRPYIEGDDDASSDNEQRSLRTDSSEPDDAVSHRSGSQIPEEEDVQGNYEQPTVEDAEDSD